MIVKIVSVASLTTTMIIDKKNTMKKAVLRVSTSTKSISLLRLITRIMMNNSPSE